MDEERYNWISKRAHEIWRLEGCPEGRDREHWSQAVNEREALEQGSPVSGDAINAPRIERVLLVDDEPIIRYATADALEEAGFVVLEAANADEALSLLKHNEIDAVVTDINMPGSMDGLGLVTCLRARSAHTRIVVTSGHVRLGSFDLASGVAFLSKPYNHQTLIRMLSEDH